MYTSNQRPPDAGSSQIPPKKDPRGESLRLVGHSSRPVSTSLPALPWLKSPERRPPSPPVARHRRARTSSLRRAWPIHGSTGQPVRRSTRPRRASEGRACTLPSHPSARGGGHSSSRPRSHRSRCPGRRRGRPSTPDATVRSPAMRTEEARIGIRRPPTTSARAPRVRPSGSSGSRRRPPEEPKPPHLDFSSACSVRRPSHGLPHHLSAVALPPSSSSTAVVRSSAVRRPGRPRRTPSPSAFASLRSAPADGEGGAGSCGPVRLPGHAYLPKKGGDSLRSERQPREGRQGTTSSDPTGVHASPPQRDPRATVRQVRDRPSSSTTTDAVLRLRRRSHRS